MHPDIVAVERLGHREDGGPATKWVLEGTLKFDEVSPYPYFTTIVTRGLGQPAQPGSAASETIKNWTAPFKEAAARVSVVETAGTPPLQPSLRVVVDNENLIGVFSYNADPRQRQIAEQKATEQALRKVVELARQPA